MQSETKSCANCKEDFLIEVDDFSFYEKIKVHPPTFCPECRRQRRLSWRNDFNFYNRICDLCKRKIISIYSPDSPQVIFCNTCWWSDKWDPKSYAQDFDFSKSFFEQFKEFREKIPALALVNDNGIGSINSEYVQNVQYAKNCYMTMVSWKLENTMYSCYGSETNGVMDCMGIFDPSEALYEAMYCGKSFNSRHICNSLALIECSFCYDCYSCENCFQCTGLRNKKYCIKNKQYTKEEYEEIIKGYKLETFSGSQKALKEFEDFLLLQPHKFSHLHNCVNSLGTNLVDSKNAKYVFHCMKAEDSKYMENGNTEKDSYDLSVGGELESCYEGLTPDNSNRALFTSYVWKSMDVSYSDFCMSSKNCFGCVGLRFGEYSIFNKQYSKEEYFIIRDKIIEHMKEYGEYGEFFPMRHSPFAYNETVAQISYPITKEEALEKGLKWQDKLQETRGKTTIFDIPDSILDIQDSILDEILECDDCKRNYKIVTDELTFYRKWKISIPRKCFFCRLERRFQIRGPSKLWHRSCMCELESHKHEDKCSNEFETSYAPERPEIIYCEQCYNKEVY
ncbi:MAG: hypothetical protein KBD52_02300 [Candidatus Pacebacteria bacterium]|nr:hypothetical protein [Candidatus Paceibacterota bacterium]